MNPNSSAPPRSSPIVDRKLGYLVLRFILGLSIFMHAMVRLPHLQEFADGLVKTFADTVLPAMLVHAFGLALVFVEAAIGLLLLLGLWTQEALLVGSATMALLVFGTALRSDWNIVAIQLLYALIYAVLLAAREYNAYSLDALIRR